MTDHSPDHAERAAIVAAGLTKAQREALDRLCANFVWADGRSVQALVRKGLAVSKALHVFGPTPTDCSVPTTFGRAVRAALNDEGKGVGEYGG